ncbi:phage tail protein [Pseudoduganella sp. DS3]|uniref:Phage tail protein n=1 Tax=Pseudoduganella guangdongensis TaxID=2692179 RepID=A0A6N9HLA5_9BURK|nr:tail fiber protein [Pseudoduganella guangdongensis]MYN04451.1 phage tail protein [Pseudoduganella guangdongensis]
MSSPFVAEIRMFACNFAPQGWATCDGQLLPISQNTALFSLLGTAYGGDGKSTFALPDLNGRMPMHPGQGQGLSLRFLGEQGGVASVTLTEAEIPHHTHQLQAMTTAASQVAPGPSSGFAKNAAGQVNHVFSQTVAGAQAVSVNPVSVAGAGQAHNNRQPYLGMLFCIALQGVFPQRW